MDTRLRFFTDQVRSLDLKFFLNNKFNINNLLIYKEFDNTLATISEAKILYKFAKM